MHDVDAMPRVVAEFLSIVDGTRSATVVAYEPLIGGYSRSMARADVEWSDGSRESFVLRGDPPQGKAMMQTDRDAEWALLRALGATNAITTPVARYYDDTGEMLGTKCIVLDFVDGRSLQSHLNEGTPEDGHRNHRDDLVDTMAAVHSIDVDSLPAAIHRPAGWSSYITALIDRFRQADRVHVESMPFLRYVAAWLDEHRPPALPLRLVHGDFQPANIVVGDSDRHNLIDWEVAHVGDPREDIGYYNVYSSASGPNLLMADPDGFLARYREQTGFTEDAVNMATLVYFSSLAAITVYSQILRGAAAMYQGLNAGLMTTYTLNALTIGHSNFLSGCTPPSTEVH
jgi:aminoglycoside phosphotransferase (APT) family kinase protein